MLSYEEILREGSHGEIFLLATALVVVFAFATAAEEAFEKDIIKTSAGNLKITFIGHGTLMFTFSGKVIHVDPISRQADYTKLPKADLVLLTHHHRDHLDTRALEIVLKSKTQSMLLI